MVSSRAYNYITEHRAALTAMPFVGKLPQHVCRRCEGATKYCFKVLIIFIKQNCGLMFVLSVKSETVPVLRRLE